MYQRCMYYVHKNVESIHRFRQIIDATRLDLSACHISREFGFTAWPDQFR